MLSTLAGLAALIALVGYLMDRGAELSAPPALAGDWHTNGPLPCVGDGHLRLTQSGVFLYVSWPHAPVGAAQGRLDGERFATMGSGGGACDGPDVRFEGTWTPTVIEGTFHAPACPVCDGVTVRGMRTP